MADPGAAILVSVGSTHIVCFQLLLFYKYTLTPILIIEIYHARHLLQVGSLSGPNLAKNMYL